MLKEGEGKRAGGGGWGGGGRGGLGEKKTSKATKQQNIIMNQMKNYS